MADIRDRTTHKTMKVFRARKVLTIQELATLL